MPNISTVAPMKYCTQGTTAQHGQQQPGGRERREESGNDFGPDSSFPKPKAKDINSAAHHVPRAQLLTSAKGNGESRRPRRRLVRLRESFTYQKGAPRHQTSLM